MFFRSIISIKIFKKNFPKHLKPLRSRPPVDFEKREYYKLHRIEENNEKKCSNEKTKRAVKQEEKVGMGNGMRDSAPQKWPFD